MKQFYPNVLYNKSQRRKALALYGLLALFCGGGGVACFLTDQMSMGIICLVVLVFFVALVPTIFSTNPVKYEPVISVDGTKVTLYGKEEIKMSDIIAVSVCLEVPKEGSTKAEMQEALEKAAAERPTEPVFGTCDLIVLDKKGKEVGKYHYVEDALGALTAFVEGGVKKYRIVYSMKKLNTVAKYSINLSPTGNSNYDALSEKDRILQLL